MNLIPLKEIIKGVWIIQAFQIPIVLFIVIFSFVTARKRIETGYLFSNESYQYPEVDHLRWIALGFIANLIYLGIHLNETVRIVRLNFVDTDLQKSAFDLLNAFLFLMAFISWYFKIRQPGNKAKAFIVAMLLLLTALIFYLRFSISYKFLCLYDCLCYFITGYLLWKTVVIPNAILKTTTARYCLLGGFSLWAVIQLFAPYIKPWNDLPGFAVSTISKLAILCGFFSFYITIVRDFMLKSNRELAANTHNLRSLQRLIDEVSKAGNLNEIEILISRHLTATLFNFDYFIFHQVDYLKRKIICQYVVSKHAGLDYIKKWQAGTSRELDQQSIITLVIKQGRTFSVDGNIIDNKPVDITDPQHQFHFHFSSPYHHEDLARFFIPVIKLTNSDTQSSTESSTRSEKVIGVFEMGYWKPQTVSVSLIKTPIDILMLYIDNFAQSYANIVEAEIRKQVRNILTEADRQSNDDELKYLQILFKTMCELIQADEGYITLQSFNRQEAITGHKIVTYKTSPAEKREFEARSNPALLERALYLGKPHFSNGSSKGMLSEIAIPLKHEGAIIGYAKVFSTQSNFFNEYNIYVLEKFFLETGPAFIAKKFHHILSELIVNESVVSELDENSQDIIHVIQKYFATDYVSIWLLDYTMEETGFKCQAYSSSIGTRWEDYGKRHILLRGDIPIFEPVDINTLETADWGIRKEHHIHSLVHIPLKIDEQQYGFINIYAERKIDKLLLEDVQFLRLIANKCVFSLVTTEMINSFSKVSQSFVAKNQTEVLQEITTIARQILHSDPVILFLFDDTKNILYGETITSGFLNEKERIYEGRASNFIELSVTQGKDKFYRSENELPKEYVKENGFWKREKIMSLAAIPLKHNNKFIGLMYFNYRQQREFPDAIKKLIKAFSALATTAIVSANNIEVIKEQRKLLEENAKALQEKAEKFEFEYADTLDKMERMLPVANAWTLAEIVRAVNHDIRNHLIKVNQNLENIKIESFNEIKNTGERTILLNNISTIEADINNSTNLISLFEPNSFKVSIESTYDIAQKVKKLFKEGNNIAINVKKKDPIPDIRCVKAELSMVMYNLTTNARNAIIEKWKRDGKKQGGPQGKIELALDYDPVERFHILTVEDDGIGIDNQVLLQIYEPNFTTRPGKGLGIGLYFVKETIENAYKGSIQCYSTVNRGTKFELKFKQHIK